MTRAWTRSCAACCVRYGLIFLMLCSANLQDRAVFAMCSLKVSWSSKITPRFLTELDGLIVEEPSWMVKSLQGRQEAQSLPGLPHIELCVISTEMIGETMCLYDGTQWSVCGEEEGSKNRALRNPCDQLMCSGYLPSPGHLERPTSEIGFKPAKWNPSDAQWWEGEQYYLLTLWRYCKYNSCHDHVKPINLLAFIWYTEEFQ